MRYRTFEMMRKFILYHTGEPRLHAIVFRFCAVVLLLLPLRMQAQNSPLDRAQQTLNKAVAEFLGSDVYPVMSAWKTGFDSTLRAPDLMRLQALRKQHRELRGRMRDLLSSMQEARRARDFRRMLDHRTKAQFIFDSEDRLLGESRRIAMRSPAALRHLEWQIDSMSQEWMAGCVRNFIDWFSRHRTVISPAMGDAKHVGLVRLMAASKDLRLEQKNDQSVFYFLLWDGSDFSEIERRNALPETPLTPPRPSRMHVYLIDDVSPNPVQREAMVRFALPEPGSATLALLDVRGRQVAMLLREELKSGVHTAALQAGTLAEGTYYLLLESGDLVDVATVQVER